MKKLAFLSAVVAVVAAQSYATTWYVDAENGNNAYDGKADAEHAVPGSNIGPKKTLGVFTSLVSSGDTIYVAPGWYSNEVSTAASNFRFYTFVGNISLISTGCATNTFIVGAAAPGVNQDSSPYGCGSGAVVPVKMLGGNNLIKGFTITGGRQASYTASASYYGGGAVFSAGDTDSMVDCIVTNCVANRGGGVYLLGNALRCRFTGNAAGEGSHALRLNCAVNCIFENTDGYAVYNENSAGTYLNCLCRGNKGGNFRTGTGPIKVYNSVFLLAENSNKARRNKKCDFYNCFFDYDISKVDSAEVVYATNGECRVFATGSIKFNADGSPTRGCPVVDAAKSSYYNDNFPGAFDAAEKAYDCLKGSRIVGDAMDIGAVERGVATVDDNEWFVDAENGDDAKSGKTPALAKKTLAAILSDRVSGDIVYAAAGVYSNDTVTVGSQLFRASIPAGVSLVGTAGAESTVILGEESENPDHAVYKTGPGAVACVYLAETSASVLSLQGFTLSCGHSVVKTGSESTSTRGSAVCGSSRTAGIVTDCVVTNCVTARGPVWHVGAVVRCRFFDNVSIDGAGGSILDVNCVADSYFRNSISGYYNTYMHDIYQTESLGDASGFVVNCTFESDGTGGPHAAGSNRVRTYNSIIKSSADPIGVKHFNCVTSYSIGGSSEKDESTIVTNSAAIALTVEGHRPVAGVNPAVGAGDYTYYTNLMPAAVAALAGKDLWGNPRRVNGVLDIGAVACDRPSAKARDTSTGLVMTGLPTDGLWHDVVAGAEYSLSRNYSSPKLLLGVNLNGEYIDFNAHDDGWAYEGVLPASGSVEVTPVYAKVNDWYVDAANGSDANDGLRPGAAHAFKTLAHASTNALMEAGATVYVAEGLYNSGVVPASHDSVDVTDNRMVVSYKINFVASGRREYTIVEGASSTDTESGMGNGAVRCCLLRGGSIRGFTLRNGNVNVGSYVEDDKGGGIKCTSTEAYAYDCEIHHCNAVRGGGAQGPVRLVRCYLHDNTNDKTGVPDRSIAGTGAFGCSGYNTVVEGDCYTGATWLNCTLTGRCWGAGTTFYNCYVGEDGSAGSGVAATFTNCVSATSLKSHSPHDGCIENRPCRFDRSNWRPRSRSSAVFDAGDYSLYTSHFPADLSAYSELDYAGGPRVREGGLDIGAGEMEYVQTGVMIIVK